MASVPETQAGGAAARYRALASLAALPDAAEHAAALATSLAESGLSAPTVLLYRGEHVVTAAVDPSKSFTLRDESPELRRLFLHALARFERDGVFYVPHARQSALAGVSSSRTDADWLFVHLVCEIDPCGTIAIHTDGFPPSDTIAELRAFAGAAAAVLRVRHQLENAQHQLRFGRILAVVNERMRRSLDRREIIAGIAETMREAFGAVRCIVFDRTLAEPSRFAVLADTGGPVVSDAGTLVRRALAGSIVRWDDEVREGHGFAASGVKSAVFVPVVVDGRIEAVLALLFDRAGAVDEEETNALRSAIFQMGMALGNVALYERERARRARAESLERIVRILRDTQFVDEVLLVFAVTASHELRLNCAVYAVDGETLVRQAMRLRENSPVTPPERLERLPLEPALAAEETTDAMLLPRTVREALFGEESGIVVPLRFENELWGMLAFGGAMDAAEWPSDDRAIFFRTLASHLEIALANAHAYERELRRAQERETLAEAARIMLGHTEMRPLADVMCRLAANLVHAERACTLRWNGERYEVIGSYGEGTNELLASLPFALDHRVTVEVPTRADERRVLRVLEGVGFAAIPLARTGAGGEGEPIDAFLVVGRTREERFARGELRILHELGALLTLALRNSELYELMQATNRALHESSQFKDDLLAMLAHDFKAPLTVILGYCELLLEEGVEQRDEIETIHAQAKRLLSLSEDALILARTQAEGFSLSRTVVDLGGFVADAVGSLARESERLVVSIAGEPLPVSLDPQRFRHVLDNLLSNALKYSTDEVVVRVERAGDRAAIRVSDRGIGIPPDELPALFTRFGRASNARNRGIAGSGIGLYVAKKIVEAHRGEITVESKENEGSTFSVLLPLAAT